MLYTKGGNKIKILTKNLKMKFVKKGHFEDWFFVVYSIFDIITRALSSLAFRGHQEDLSLKRWHGNFCQLYNFFLDILRFCIMFWKCPKVIKNFKF